MEEVKLHPRLAAILPIIEELRELKGYLEKANPNCMSGHVFDSEIRWIDNALERIRPHMHGRCWPPVWWRLTTVHGSISWVITAFCYVDSDGKYLDWSASGDPIAYIPERAEIMARVDRIKAMYEGR